MGVSLAAAPVGGGGESGETGEEHGDREGDSIAHGQGSSSTRGCSVSSQVCGWG